MECLTKSEITQRLARLRAAAEAEAEMPDMWYYGLFDVAQTLELNDEQTAAVVGPRGWTLVAVPMPLKVGEVFDGVL